MDDSDAIDARDRKCPFCGQPQFIDPVESHSVIECTNCGELASFGSWCNPSDSPHWAAIAETTGDSFTENISRHTIAYTTMADGGGVASGTVVSVGSHLLIATVAHTLLPPYEQVGLVAKNKPTSGNRNRWVIGQATDESLDIGAIEIDASALDDLSIVAIQLDRIVDAGNGNPLLKTRVIGYPWESHLDDIPQRGVRGFRALSYGSETIHVAAWRNINVGNLDPGLHLLAAYEREDNVDWSRDFFESVSNPNPKGMSGGGYWQRSRKLGDKEMWEPDGLCLCGIQSAWYEKKSYIKGVQIAYWLKLVANNFPDVSEELATSFPRIKDI